MVKRICSEPKCSGPHHALGLCRHHYNKLTKNPSREMFPTIGPKPGKGEKAIYFLRNRRDNKPFYVGSTSNTSGRYYEHRITYSSEIDLVVVKCCPIGEEVYWESKLLVELTEAGIELKNTRAPQVK